MISCSVLWSTGRRDTLLSIRVNDGSELERNEFSDGSGLDWYDTEFRKYDPQIGRWNQIDDLYDENPSWSGYSFVQNNPLLFNDPLGLDTLMSIIFPKTESLQSRMY